jgi:hypothetical protein
VVVIEQVRHDDEQAVQVPLMGIMEILEHELWHVPLLSTRLAVHDVQVVTLVWQVRQLRLQLSQVLPVMLATVTLTGHVVLQALLYR